MNTSGVRGVQLLHNWQVDRGVAGGLFAALASILLSCSTHRDDHTRHQELSASASASGQATIGIEVWFDGEPTPADIAVVVVDYSSWSPPPYESVVFCAWRSGRFLVSDSPRWGGAPFTEHACDAGAFDELQAEVGRRMEQCSELAPSRRPSASPLSVCVFHDDSSRSEVWAYHPFQLDEEKEREWVGNPNGRAFAECFDGLMDYVRGVVREHPVSGHVFVGVQVR